MPSNQQSSAQQTRSPRSESATPSKDKSKSEEWADVQDPSERRKIQNKLAQRRFRDKAKEQREENERGIENQRRAGNSYASPEPSDLSQGHELSGLPWGGISMRHIVESGKTKNSRQSSRENSVYAAASRSAGGSSRLGLRLTDQFARGHPAWRFVGLSQAQSGSSFPTQPYFPYRHPKWDRRDPGQ